MKKVMVTNYKKDSLYPKVVKASARLLQKHNEFTTVDIMLQMGNIFPKDLERWEKGQVPYLERVFRGSLSKANRILGILGFHTHDLNMVRSQKQPISGKIRQFSKSGDEKLEKQYSICFRWNQSNEKKWLM